MIGAYATLDIARRELRKSLKDYIGDLEEEDIDTLIEEGELESSESKIRFGEDEVNGEPKKVCLLASYYVDYGDFNYFRLIPSKRDFAKICKEFAQYDENCEDCDNPKMVNARAKEIKEDFYKYGSSYYNPLMGDPLDLYLSDFVSVKSK